MARGNKVTYASRARQIVNKYKRRLGEDLSGNDKLATEAMNKELENLKQEQELDRAIMYKDMNKSLSMEDFAFGGTIPQYAGGGLFGRRNMKPLTSDNWVEGPDPNPNGYPIAPYKVNTNDYIAGPTVTDLQQNIDPAYVTAKMPSIQSRLAKGTPGYYMKSYPAAPIVLKLPNGQVSTVDPSKISSVGDFMGGYVPSSTSGNQTVKTASAVPATTAKTAGSRSRTNQTITQATTPGVVDPNKVYHPEVLGLTPITPRGLTSNLPKHLRPQDENGVQISIPGNERAYSTPVSPLGLLPSLVGYGMNAAAINKMSKNRYTPQMVSPERISLAGARTAAEARRRSSANLLKGLASATSPSQRYAQALAGVTEADRGYGEAINESFLNEQTQNASYSDRAKMFNAEQAARARELNMGLKNSILNARLSNNMGLVQGAAGYMKDVATQKQYDAYLNMASDNYERVVDPSYQSLPWYQRTGNYLMGNRPYVNKVRNFEKLR